MMRFSKSLSNALRGISHAARREKNFTFEIVAAVTVGVLLVLGPYTALERAILLLACGAVLSLELANTALEKAIDIVKPNVHPFARLAKDLMAGAVLVSAFVAIMVGMLVTWEAWVRASTGW